MQATQLNWHFSVFNAQFNACIVSSGKNWQSVFFNVLTQFFIKSEDFSLQSGQWKCPSLNLPFLVGQSQSLPVSRVVITVFHVDHSQIPFRANLNISDCPCQWIFTNI
jgi:hypothetical protein